MALACCTGDGSEGGCSLECLQAVCKVQQLAKDGQCQDAQVTMQLMGATFRQLDASCMAEGRSDMMPAKFKCAAVSGQCAASQPRATAARACSQAWASEECAAGRCCRS